MRRAQRRARALPLAVALAWLLCSCSREEAGKGSAVTGCEGMRVAVPNTPEGQTRTAKGCGVRRKAPGRVSPVRGWVQREVRPARAGQGGEPARNRDAARLLYSPGLAIRGRVPGDRRRSAKKGGNIRIPVRASECAAFCSCDRYHALVLLRLTNYTHRRGTLSSGFRKKSQSPTRASTATPHAAASRRSVRRLGSFRPAM